MKVSEQAHWFGHGTFAKCVGFVLCCGTLTACAPRLRAGQAQAVKSASAAATAGKSASQVPRPADAIAAYREALERDDPAAAYRLLSPTVQQHLSLDKWSERWKETQLERAAQRKLLLEGNRPSGTLGLQAAIALPQGTVLMMAPAPAGTSRSPAPNTQRNRAADWQIADPDLAAVHAETPEQVLHLLVEAVEQRNYFALLRLLSTTERKALEAELRERVERLRNSLSRQKASGTSAATSTPIEVHGDRARYQYDPRFFVDLVRERDGWRVLDLN